MAIVLPYGDAKPSLGRDVFLAPTAAIVGDVGLGDQSSVWFGAVLRGDVGSIRIGARTNLQDSCCLHVTGGVSAVTVGDEVTVGHGATLHGCTVGDGCLIGIGSVVLDNATIGEGAVVAAGALVPPGMVVRPRTVVRGVPAKEVAAVADDQAQRSARSAQHYVELAAHYQKLVAGMEPGITETGG